jgi:hypothetical protein
MNKVLHEFALMDYESITMKKIPISHKNVGFTRSNKNSTEQSRIKMIKFQKTLAS